MSANILAICSSILSSNSSLSGVLIIPLLNLRLYSPSILPYLNQTVNRVLACVCGRAHGR